MENQMKKSDYLSLLFNNENVNTNHINCERPGCTSTDIKSWEWATRAADEGVTIFFKCRKCKYVWMES